MENRSKREIWQYPWSFAESFLIAFGLCFTGFLLEMFSNNHLNLPEWPYNLLLAIFILLIILISYFLYGKYPIIRFLSSSEASIGAISLYAVLVLLMGFLPQDEILPFGISNLRQSWPFVLSSLYILYILGLVILRRLRSKNKSKIVFTLNHMGLWIIILTAGLGSSDLKRFSIESFEKTSVNFGYNKQGEGIKLPFTIKLNDFNIDEFPARLVCVDYQTNQISKDLNNGFLIEKNKEFDIEEYKIKVDKYFIQAIPDATGYISSEDSFAGQAAYIVIKDQQGKLIKEGWISSGSPFYKSSYISLDEKHYLAMTLPEPKRFSSDIEITDSKGRQTNIKLEVNKPYKIDGWKIYQTGYDTRMGKYSTLSIIEAVRDPWIPVVYIGLLMLISGSILLFFKGRKEA